MTLEHSRQLRQKEGATLEPPHRRPPHRTTTADSVVCGCRPPGLPRRLPRARPPSAQSPLLSGGAGGPGGSYTATRSTPSCERLPRARLGRPGCVRRDPGLGVQDLHRVTALGQGATWVCREAAPARALLRNTASHKHHVTPKRHPGGGRVVCGGRAGPSGTRRPARGPRSVCASVPRPGRGGGRRAEGAFADAGTGPLRGPRPPPLPSALQASPVDVGL